MFCANRRGRSHSQARSPRGPQTSTRRGDRQAGVSLTEYVEQPRCQAYDNERTSQGMTMADAEWILLNPGPANTTPTVRRALVMPDLCHREPEFFQIMRSCRERLVRLAGGSSDWTAVLFTGSGTAAVEAALASAVPPDGGVLVLNNGVYGDRMIRICRAHNIRHHAISYDNVTPVAPAEMARVLREHRRLTHVAVVHHETTTGVLNPVAEVADVAAAEGRRVVVDAMSSLYGEPLDVTREGIDFVMASANKCLQGIPGVSFVIARRSAVEALRGRAPRSVYLDLYNHYVQQEADNTPFTPAVQVLHAMEQALRELETEGVANRVARYAEACRVLRDGMAELGFEILVPAGARSNILTTFRLTAGVTYDALHDAMKRRGYIIYAGQGDIRTYAFRVSNMGTLTPLDMKAVVDAFAASLDEIGVAVAPRRG
ncbi:MAG: 2-aminoethylphosphonate--pyruvate transaminase [Candidatus Rokuibacteriota bacterium]|nr:MAG: 2-aminoethylphosphonate--pyruvate transaminase [Candidatus Rokubacteria bacterium]